jgi:hypothetical protein
MHDMFAYLTELMTQQAGLFETQGQNLFRDFAIIMIVWFGLKTALSAAGGGHSSGFHFDHFAAFLLTISFGFGMMTYYSHPIPGFGVSFYHLIIDQGLALANQLDDAIVQQVLDRLNNWVMETQALTLSFTFVEILRYAVTLLCVTTVEAAMFGVIAFGYVAASVAVLLGPIGPLILLLRAWRRT